jgi:hypothetical protein
VRIPLAVTTLLAVAAASAFAAAQAHRQPHAAGGLRMLASVHRFTLKAVPVRGLYPGASRPLQVKVANGYAYKIKVPPLKAKAVASTNRQGCAGTAANLVATASKRAITIPAHASRTLVVTVRMPATVANACQGATFRISLTGRATRG